MKSIIPTLLFAFIFSFVSASAQQTHFIYIQTNDKQAFYIKLNNTIYSSTASGYLIVSKLVDSTYTFSVGFPKGEWPQQNFSCVIDKNDEGYLLKNFGDKGWGLFNLQTLDVTMAGNVAKDKNITRVERTDSFSNMLSAVVNDPGIKQTEVAKPEPKPEVQQDNIQPTQDTQAVAAVQPVTEKPVTVIKPAAKSTIIKLLDKTNADGTELVYLDFDGEKKDTIRIFIPADKTSSATHQDNTAVAISPVVESTPPAVISAPAKQEPTLAAQDKKFIDMQVPVSNPKQDSSLPAQQVVSTNTTKASITNTNCKNVASEEDFLRLRKKMAGADDDDAMVNTAKKVFTAKCFTTSQVRNLGFLFLSDKGRYRFFDMAYSYVSDPENFASLQSQLSDQYFLNRFKAMVTQ